MIIIAAGDRAAVGTAVLEGHRHHIGVTVEEIHTLEKGLYQKILIAGHTKFNVIAEELVAVIMNISLCSLFQWCIFICTCFAARNQRIAGIRVAEDQVITAVISFDTAAFAQLIGHFIGIEAECFISDAQLSLSVDADFLTIYIVENDLWIAFDSGHFDTAEGLFFFTAAFRTCTDRQGAEQHAAHHHQCHQKGQQPLDPLLFHVLFLRIFALFF